MKATRAIIVSFSGFSRNSEAIASELGVECLDIYDVIGLMFRELDSHPAKAKLKASAKQAHWDSMSDTSKYYARQRAGRRFEHR